MENRVRTTNHHAGLAGLAAIAVLCLPATACIGPVDDGAVLEREQAGAALGEGPQCREEVVDVNECGEPWKCRYLRHLLVQEDRECCAPSRRQHVDKLFYDCDGDGGPDCELDQWYSFEDPRCGPAEVEEIEEESA